MQKPWVAPENRPSVISATFVPSPCVLDRVLVYAHARQNTDANNRHARERAWCLHLRFILWVHALELTNAHAVCACACMHVCAGVLTAPIMALVGVSISGIPGPVHSTSAVIQPAYTGKIEHIGRQYAYVRF